MVGVQQAVAATDPLKEKPRGDCLRACLCSVLELPIDAIPNVIAEDDWWERLTDHLREHHGFELWNFDFDEGTERFAPLGYWIAAVPSLNLPPAENGEPYLHAVVMKGERLAWDPSAKRRYEQVALDEVHGAKVLVPLDPARTRA